MCQDMHNYSPSRSPVLLYQELSAPALMELQQFDAAITVRGQRGVERWCNRLRPTLNSEVRPRIVAGIPQVGNEMSVDKMRHRRNNGCKESNQGKLPVAQYRITGQELPSEARAAVVTAKGRGKSSILRKFKSLMCKG